MPRKAAEDIPYNPIAVDLAREVARAGRSAPHEPPPKPPERAADNPGLVVSPRILPRISSACVTKRFVLTRKEEDDLNQFLMRLQSRAGTKVTLSVIVRAAVTILMQAETQILDEIGDRFPQEYPSTHDTIAMGTFEERWTRHLAKALKRLPTSLHHS